MSSLHRFRIGLLLSSCVDSCCFGSTWFVAFIVLTVVVAFRFGAFCFRFVSDRCIACARLLHLMLFRFAGVAESIACAASFECLVVSWLLLGSALVVYLMLLHCFL